jgi:hypothetical protein
LSRPSAAALGLHHANRSNAICWLMIWNRSAHDDAAFENCIARQGELDQPTKAALLGVF